MTGHLAIIPCTKNKIWDDIPDLGPVYATCAYTGPEFVLAKALASKFADRIVILSAKYGFLDPWDRIPQTYDVTFSRPNDPFIGMDELKEQAKKKGLLEFSSITAIGNSHYQKRICEALSNPKTKIHLPADNVKSEEELCKTLVKLLMA